MKRLTLLALSVLVAMAFVLPATAAAAPPDRGALLHDLAFSGTNADTGDPVTGTLDITEITRDGSQLLFSGTATSGGITESFTDVPGTLTAGAQTAAVAQAVCDVLQLDLGPLDLDLLGLVVNLSPISLNIDAVSGPGNLLGNLLCAVAGLLDGGLDLGSILDRILMLINNILG